MVDPIQERMARLRDIRRTRASACMLVQHGCDYARNWALRSKQDLFAFRDICNSYNGGEYMKWLTEFLDRVAEFLITGLICTILAGMWVYVLLYM